MNHILLPVPHLQQQERGECLAACAAMLLAYVAFVKTGELPYWDEDCDHAVVVAGLDDEVVYLNDPAFPDAPVQVPRGDFDLAWLGRDEFFAALVV